MRFIYCKQFIFKEEIKMKMKHVTSALLAVMLITFANCGSGPKASGSDELDIAIREASDYLNTRILAGSKAAFINISGGYPDLSDYILSDLSKHAVNDGVFSVVDRAQLDAVRAELNFNLSGEVDDDSAQAIGKMLGAQTIVSGSIRKIGSSFRLDIKAITVQTAQVQGQWNKNIPNGATIAALTENTAPGAAVAGGTASAGRTSGGSAAQAPARSAAPKNGTYTFYPRLRAIQGAVECNVYLDRIVVRNGNLAVYLFNTPLGRGGGPPNPWVGTGSSGVILQDLDNPRRTWNIVSQQMDIDGWGVGGSMISFEGVTGRRFTLNSGTGYGNVAMIFEDIILGEPDE
jgi:hypothetical protein